jgi:hypothetical protein
VYLSPLSAEALTPRRRDYRTTPEMQQGLRRGAVTRFFK